MTVYVFHMSLARESLFWSALLERGYIGLKIIKTIRGKKKTSIKFKSLRDGVMPPIHSIGVLAGVFSTQRNVSPRPNAPIDAAPQKRVILENDARLVCPSAHAGLSGNIYHSF